VREADLGLGSMGFPMAANLRKKISKESVLYVNDVDTSAVDRFVKELSSYGPIKVCSTAKEITEKSVLASFSGTNVG
jgi:3-hydroxyisobutyrate/3-hydroxypropionate dehydrogenase